MQSLTTGFFNISVSTEVVTRSVSFAGQWKA